MEMKKAAYFYFSPTETTKGVLGILKEAIDLPGEELDMTEIPPQDTVYAFGQDTLLVIGVPVYGGRVPKTALQRFEALQGNQTPAILIVTYGNRDYDDALLELTNVLTEKGFCPISAGAIVVQHSIVPSIGEGRPDEKDREAIASFAQNSIKKLEALEDITQLQKLQVKGNPEYRKYQTIPLVPHTSGNCTGCGLCAKKCPTGAIPANAPKKTDKEHCISCLRCIKFCPQQARSLHKLELMAAKQLIKSKCTANKQPEFFL